MNRFIAQMCFRVRRTFPWAPITNIGREFARDIWLSYSYHERRKTIQEKSFWGKGPFRKRKRFNFL